MTAPTKRRKRRHVPLRCPACKHFVSETNIRCELEIIDPDESTAEAWQEWVACKFCDRDVWFGFKEAW